MPVSTLLYKTVKRRSRVIAVKWRVFPVTSAICSSKTSLSVRGALSGQPGGRNIPPVQQAVLY
jgi:hypothetical protein